MAKPTSDTDTTIESLLQQRAQYEQWLARLDSAGDKAPPAVRARVRSDYEARLRGVIDQLRGFAATIAEELDRHKSTQTGLDGERRQAEEALSEAEVRHAVGEYSEDEWQRINDQSAELLGRLRGELRAVGDEIARLAEVQGLIGGAPKRVEPPAPAPPPPPPVAVVPEPEPEPERVAPPPPAPAAPVAATRPAPKPAPREPEITHGPPPVDELAFLKSVAPEEERKPAPAPAQTAGRRASNPGASAARSSEGSGAASQTAAPGKPGAAGGAKTLKCGECGTLNRPTEWYCERCGAELAGI
jgi:hypothetical protein